MVQIISASYLTHRLKKQNIYASLKNKLYPLVAGTCQNIKFTFVLTVSKQEIKFSKYQMKYHTHQPLVSNE